VETRRLLVASVWGIIIGAICGPIGIVLLVGVLSEQAHNNAAPGPNFLIDLLCALGLLVPLGIVRGVQAMLHPGGSYTVYEHGFIYRPRRGGETVVPWSDVAEVRTRGSQAYGGFKHWFGLGFKATIRCASGSAFKLDGMTSSAPVFCSEVRHHVEAYQLANNGPQTS
jgi:hypothetical protein